MALVVFDLDEFTVDSSARALQATKPDGKLDWNVMFRGDLIFSLDKPILSALARLNELEAQGQEIWYVTSRQADKCHDATVAWLEREQYPFPQNVICRPPFVKTVVFKAEAVARLHKERGPVVLFADNSEANLAAVAALGIEGLAVSDSLL